MAGVTLPGYNTSGSAPAGMTWDPVTKSFKPSVSDTNGYPQGSVTPYGDTNVAGSNKTASQAAADTGADYTVTQNGGTDYSNKSAQDKMLLQERARLQAEAEARRLASLSSYTNGNSTLMPRETYAGSIADTEAAAKSAAFARAKDQAGQIARAALQGVQENVAGRGVAGGGIEALKTAGVVQDAANPLQELTRDQMINDYERAATVSDNSYQGGITQRGQDIAQKNAQSQSLIALMQAAYGGSLY